MCVSGLQVSDQLVEINGDSTAGMTHSQAVEQIRRGGHRIHLVLKRGNGYVPDYGETQQGMETFQDATTCDCTVEIITCGILRKCQFELDELVLHASSFFFTVGLT